MNKVFDVLRSYIGAFTEEVPSQSELETFFASLLAEKKFIEQYQQKLLTIDELTNLFLTHTYTTFVVELVGGYPVLDKQRKKNIQKKLKCILLELANDRMK